MNNHSVDFSRTILAAAVLASLYGQSATALTVQWVGPDGGTWSNPINWDRSGFPTSPQNGDDVFIKNNSTSNQTALFDFVDFDPTSGAALSTLTIQGNNSASMNLHHTNATNTPNANMAVNQLNIGTNGQYTLDRGQLFAVETQISGTGIGGKFDLTGDSTHATGRLSLGKQSGSNGSYYILNQDHPFLVASDLVIGDAGNGYFQQDGGTVYSGVFPLFFGVTRIGVTGSGEYNMRGGSLLSTFTTIGDAGTGTFRQSNDHGNSEHYTSQLVLGNLTDSVGNYYMTESGTNPFLSSLSAQDSITVGNSGRGEFIQDSGQVVTDRLVLGNQTDGNGIYEIHNHGTGSTPTLEVHDDAILGNAGNGGIRQETGLVTIGGSALLGLSESGRGRYTLAGGTLIVGGTTDVGINGHASFDLYNSTGNASHNTKSLIVDTTPIVNARVGSSSYSIYDEKNGYSLSLNVQDTAIIGSTGEGVVNQYGGNVTIGNKLGIGENAAKGYWLIDGGNMNVGGQTIVGVGAGSRGALSLENEFGNALHQTGGLILGDASNSSGRYYLTDSGNGHTAELHVTGNATLGNNGYGEIFQDGGKFIVDGQTIIGNSNTFDARLSGILQTNTSTDSRYTTNSLLVTHGHYDLYDAGNGHALSSTITTDATIKFGSISQRGGSLSIGNTLVIGQSSNETGGYFLDGGIMTASNTSINGQGFLSQSNESGNSSFVTHTLMIGITNGSNSSLGTSDAGNGNSLNFHVTGDATLGQNGIASLYLGGGHAIFDGTVKVDGIRSGTDSGQLFDFFNGSRLWIAGASVTSNLIDISNTASLVFSDGTLTATGHISNNGHMTIFGADVVGSIPGAAPKTINGIVNNNGTVTVTDTTIVYTGTFNNNGAYISDPSDNHFNDLIVGTTGYVQGGAGDRFFISGNFINNSQQNTLWDTDEAVLAITGLGTHIVAIAGLDMGQNIDGLVDNFAWGELFIDIGAILALVDGNTANGSTALYVREFELFGHNLSLLANILGDINIYYDALLSENAYLLGANYRLGGSGWLLPYPIISIGTTIPEPMDSTLFGIGIVMLTTLHAQRKRNNRTI